MGVRVSDGRIAGLNSVCRQRFAFGGRKIQPDPGGPVKPPVFTPCLSWRRYLAPTFSATPLGGDPHRPRIQRPARGFGEWAKARRRVRCPPQYAMPARAVARLPFREAAMKRTGATEQGVRLDETGLDP